MKHTRARFTQKSAAPPSISNKGMQVARLSFHDQSSLSETLDSAGGRKIEGVIIGKLAALAESGEPLVDFPANPGKLPLEARSLVSLNESHIRQDAALLFESG